MIQIKNEKDLRYIRQACKIAAEVLLKISQIIKEGITTREIDAFAEEWLIKKGAKPAFKGYKGYRHATCLSLNAEVVHGIPDNRVIKDGDLIGVDVGSIYEGYFGDVAQTFPVGKVSKKAFKLMRAGKEALDKAIKQARPGNHLGDISHVIEEHAIKNGYEVVRNYFGHGVGYQLHEDPLIPNYGNPGEGPLLKPGMVLAIEPMLNEGACEVETLSDGWTVITVDRKLSVHFEHTILITDKGSEILTLA